MELIGFFLAALVGISLGLIGGGGSILTLPILVYIMGIQPIIATSYSLFIVGCTSLVGATINYKSGNVQVKTALVFGIASISTVFLTRKFIIPHIPNVLFTINHVAIRQSVVTMSLFAVLMLLAAIAMIRNPINKDVNECVYTYSTPPIFTLILNGILIGFATGFFGAGGGFLLIPSLVLLFKMPMKQAVGTSLLIIALNSLIGFLGDWGHYHLNWQLLFTITAIAVGGIFVGSFISTKINSLLLKKTFGWFVLFMSIYILTKEIFQF